VHAPAREPVVDERHDDQQVRQGVERQDAAAHERKPRNRRSQEADCRQAGDYLLQTAARVKGDADLADSRDADLADPAYLTGRRSYGSHEPHGTQIIRISRTSRDADHTDLTNLTGRGSHGSRGTLTGRGSHGSRSGAACSAGCGRHSARRKQPWAGEIGLSFPSDP
jgi:hypothetical protein